jgi:CheY-like chemotaxis protein
MGNVSPKVLVAEDNKVLGDVLRFNLERAGFTVTLARSGDAAAKAVSQDSYDLLFTDIEMPGMNGLELCRFIREELGNTGLPIVICSARGLEIDERQIRDKYGVSELVFKPFSVRDLVATANRLLTPKVDSQRLASEKSLGG